MRKSVELATKTVTIEPGDLLVLFTDGLPEAVSGADSEAFGFARIRDLVAADGSPKAIHDRILLAFDGHMGPEPLTDDLTLVVMART
jgi:serine phosphatase RsbU (regulator of sigma subunit)